MIATGLLSFLHQSQTTAEQAPLRTTRQNKALTVWRVIKALTVWRVIDASWHVYHLRSLFEWLQ